MKEALRDLIMSESEEDNKLAVIILKKKYKFMFLVNWRLQLFFDIFFDDDIQLGYKELAEEIMNDGGIYFREPQSRKYFNSFKNFKYKNL